ncbi:MAG: histidine phosphatase family protein [Deferribacterales bacterium]
MLIYLIRHGHAEDRLIWNEPDIKRPLTAKGRSRADKAFSKFFSIYAKPEKIITSEANRAFETAEILCRHCGVEYIVRGCLNPGAVSAGYMSVLNEFADAESIAIVGHEPDMSEFASEYLSNGNLNIVLKKGSVIHIEDGCLVNVIQQKVLL